jgi:hypothetical protein
MVAFRVSLCCSSANAAAHGCKLGRVAGASQPDGSVPPFRALSRYASDTDNSCVSPQWGHSSLSVFFHDARRLCGSVSIPVGTCRPVLGQVNNSSDIRALSCVDVGLGSASALHVKHRSLPSRLPYSACASSRTALALIPSAITALQRSQTSVTLITSSHLGAPPAAGGSYGTVPEAGMKEPFSNAPAGIARSIRNGLRNASDPAATLKVPRELFACEDPGE